MNNPHLLHNKVCLITGAAQGIGLEVAKLFALHGARLILVDLDEEQLLKAMSCIDSQAILSRPCNVADEKQVHKLFDSITELDILINNAGITRDNKLENMSIQDFDMVTAVNQRGVFLCGQSAAAIMKKQQSGVIINASSVVASRGNYGQSNYSASKAAVTAMTQTWAKELGPHGIRVNAVAPGFIDTRMTQAIPDKVRDKITQQIPLSRLGSPEEVAQAYLWLASDQSSYVHGHVLEVNGGL